MSKAIRDDTWRIFRIMAEFVEGFQEMADVGRSITIFGSARTRPSDPYYIMARTLGKRLGEEGYTVITGGGPGIMEAGNRGAKEANAISVGVNIQLPFEQSSNPYITKLINFRYFFVRKVMFLKYAKGFVIFPGGFGTMDELFETLTLIQTRKIEPMPIVLMGKKYYGGMLDWIKDTMLGEKMISPDDLDIFLLTDDVEECIAHLKEKTKTLGDKDRFLEIQTWD